MGNIITIIKVQIEICDYFFRSIASRGETGEPPTSQPEMQVRDVTLLPKILR